MKKAILAIAAAATLAAGTMTVPTTADVTPTVADGPCPA